MRLQEEIKEILESKQAIIFQEKRNQLRDEACKAIQKIQAENKRSYNKKRKLPNKYREGDVVAIQRIQGGPGLKFSTQFLGPYRQAYPAERSLHRRENRRRGRSPYNLNSGSHESMGKPSRSASQIIWT